MKYEPELTNEEIEKNHEFFEERRNVYKAMGLDFLKSREVILDRAGPLRDDILDIGSGRGVMALSLARKGYDFVSIDNNEEMLKITALNLAYENLLKKADLQVMDAYSLDFDDNSFDTVVMVEALHHIDDVEGILSEIDSVLRKDGKLVLSDFNKTGMQIVDRVHNREGREHVDLSTGTNKVNYQLLRRGYKITNYNDACHWTIIAERK